MQSSDIAKIFAFIDVVNSLKYEMRYSGIRKPELRDSVAAHCWRMALLSYLVAEQFNRTGELKLDTLKILKLVLIHDLAEAIIGDIPYPEICANPALKKDKYLGEREAMLKLKAMLPESLGDEVMSLWEDYESNNSLEAKFAIVMDRFEAAHHSISMGVNNMQYVSPIVTHSNKCYGWVPEFDELIRYVREELRAHFAEHGEPWLPEYELK